MVETLAAGTVVARDVLLRVGDHADRYAIHAALDERWGRRAEVQYLWCLGRVSDGAAVRVRLPREHPDGMDGVAVIVPEAGTVLHFRLCANVTRKDGRSGQRIAWPQDEVKPRLRWLDRRAAQYGYRVEQVEASVGRALIRKGEGFWIDETTFTGRLTVFDVAGFAAALAGGVGPRSAFGFGLLETF
jgi:hypothetical protein